MTVSERCPGRLPICQESRQSNPATLLRQSSTGRWIVLFGHREVFRLGIGLQLKCFQSVKRLSELHPCPIEAKCEPLGLAQLIEALRVKNIGYISRTAASKPSGRSEERRGGEESR